MEKVKYTSGNEVIIQIPESAPGSVIRWLKRQENLDEAMGELIEREVIKNEISKLLNWGVGL